MDLKQFEKFKGKETVLTKIGSKRSSRVGIGQNQNGEMDIFIYEATDKMPEQFGVIVYGRGFDFLRTSPIVKVTDETEKGIVFETEGGIYRLELDSPETGYDCKDCGKQGEVKDMTLKMGGLLCPHCRTILFWPGSRTYGNEFRRRRDENDTEE